MAYQVDYDEVVVLKEDSVYDHTHSSNNFVKGELLLTSKALVFSRKNMLGKVTNSQVYPLSSIAVLNEKPQVKLVSNFGIKDLEVLFTNGSSIKLGIGEGLSKASILKWVDAIYEVMTGHTYTEYDKSAYALPGMKTIANYASGTVDAFKRSFGVQSKEPEKVVKYCQNCGAQITGRAGDIGTCPYCGSKQKL